MVNARWRPQSPRELLRFASGANTPSVPSHRFRARELAALQRPERPPVQPGDLEIEIVPLAKVIARWLCCCRPLRFASRTCLRCMCSSSLISLIECPRSQGHGGPGRQVTLHLVAGAGGHIGRRHRQCLARFREKQVGGAPAAAAGGLGPHRGFRLRLLACRHAGFARRRSASWRAWSRWGRAAARPWQHEGPAHHTRILRWSGRPAAQLGCRLSRECVDGVKA